MKYLVQPVSLFFLTIFVLVGFLVLSSGVVNAVTNDNQTNPIVAQAETNKDSSTKPVPAPKKPTVDSKSDDKPSDAGGFVPCGNSVDDPCNVGHLFRAFVAIINYLIGMAGFVAILFIVYSGVMMVASQGEAMLSEAKKRFSGAIIGLVIVAVAFITINTIFASGSLSLGVKNGALIFTNPKEYISNTE